MKLIKVGGKSMVFFLIISSWFFAVNDYDRFINGRGEIIMFPGDSLAAP